MINLLVDAINIPFNKYKSDMLVPIHGVFQFKRNSFKLSMILNHFGIF